MKKLFLILAASAVLFACGGGNKKAPTVEDKAVEYTKKAMELEESGDYVKLMELAEEMEEWAKGLTPEEQKRAEEAIMKYMEGVDPDFVTDEEYYDDDEEYYYEDDEEYYEEEEIEMSASEWDEVLDEYEEYVDEYIELYKDAMAGDMDAMTELAEMSEELAEFATEVGEVADQLTVAQANRFNKIAQKLANALQ
jgi:response regulator RpfG family c-di-GMP phosphodiesterase